MPRTTVAYSANIATTTAYQNIAAIADQHITVVTPRIYMGDLNQIVGVGAALGTNATAGYLDAPSLRRVVNYDIDPFTLAINLTDNGTLWFPENPLPLIKNEGLEALFIGTAVAAQVLTVVVHLSDGPIAPVSGEIFSVRAMSAITTVASTWVNGALTFRQTLPVGRYQLVGASCMSANGVAFRFVPIGEAYRPGGFCKTAYSDREYPYQRKGKLGVWCEFDSVTPPSIDVLAEAVDTTQTLVLDLIKIA